MSSLLGKGCFDRTVKQHYLALSQSDKCQVTYIWIDQAGERVQCKTQTFDSEPTGVEEIPEWNTVWIVDHGQSFVEMLLVPVRMFPYTLDPNKLVLCEVRESDRGPTGSNHRDHCATIIEQVKGFHPWFAMEQEYKLFGLDEKPFGWPLCELQASGGHYCGVGADKSIGRDISVCHYKACLYAGVKISGSNAETVASMWEFQVGPCEGIETGDHLWVARFLLWRVCKDFGVTASLDPKPLGSRCPGAGCHSNFSTWAMRTEGGLMHIEKAIEKLRRQYTQHLCVYDVRGVKDNARRLCGRFSCPNLYEFSAGVSRRDASVRIPGHVNLKGCGYFEDRRPAANCDPYSVMTAMSETCLLATSEE